MMQNVKPTSIYHQETIANMISQNQLSKADPNHSGPLFRLSKKSKDFSDSLKNAVTFPPLRGGKVLAALAERLAKQGIQGIRSHSRRAAAPSSSPANTRADSSKQRFFDKQSGPADAVPLCISGCHYCLLGSTEAIAPAKAVSGMV